MKMNDFNNTVMNDNIMDKVAKELIKKSTPQQSEDKKYEFYCMDCHRYFSKMINNITKKHRNHEWCPHCSLSKGEKEIENWLRLNNIDYVYEKYKVFNFVFAWIGGFCSICLFCLFQDFILVWTRDSSYLISTSMRPS